MIRVYRMQDASGRGPWRPGFSRTWVDPEGTTHLDPSFQPFNPQAVSRILRTVPHLRYHGFGCRSKDEVLAWFTTKEITMLFRLGFGVVCLDADRVLFETKRQLLFARRKPLNEQVTVVMDVQTTATNHGDHHANTR